MIQATPPAYHAHPWTNAAPRNYCMGDSLLYGYPIDPRVNNYCRLSSLANHQTYVDYSLTGLEAYDLLGLAVPHLDAKYDEINTFITDVGTNEVLHTLDGTPGYLWNIQKPGESHDWAEREAVYDTFLRHIIEYHSPKRVLLVDLYDWGNLFAPGLHQDETSGLVWAWNDFVHDEAGRLQNDPRYVGLQVAVVDLDSPASRAALAVPDLHYKDGLHFTPAGYAVIASIVKGYER